jgi:NADH-quinone oxidoreductase subunit H
LPFAALGTAVALLYLLPIAFVYRFYGGAWQTRIAVSLFCLLAFAPLALAALRQVGKPERSFLAEPWRGVEVWTAWALSLGLCVLAVAFASQSVSPARIIRAQVNTQPFALSQPLGMAAFVLAAAGLLVGARRRATGGTPSWYLALIPIALAALLSAMAAALYLAGGDGPGLPGVVWFTLKTGALGGVMAAVAARVSRGAVERRAALAWLAALSLAFLNLLAVLAIVGTQS